MRIQFLLLAIVNLVGSGALAFDHTHSKLADVLRQAVTVSGSVSEVNYSWLKAHPQILDAYVDDVQAVSQKEFDSMSKDQRLAFLINGYNALTMKLVVDHFPVKSIKDIGGLFSSPWKKEFFKLLGQSHSLDDIEHKLIRPVFQEPRVHFALVCASKGCPKLNDKPFLASSLDSQLNSAADGFLNDPARNSYDSKKNEFQISSIFKWYGDDFSKSFGSIQKFLSSKMRLPVGASPESLNSASLVFRDYDWSLNGH